MNRRHAEVANHFFTDASDLLLRFELTRNDFFVSHSRQAKLYVDLRIAYECALKAVVALSLDDSLSVEEIQKGVEGFGHQIERLELSAFPSLSASYDPLGPQIDRLPVSLRYRIDGWEFRDAKEELFFATVRSEPWIDSLHERTRAILGDLNSRLHGLVECVTGDAITEQVLKRKPRKYRNP